MLDLHLFLGRAVQLPRGRGKEATGGRVYGSVPQSLADVEQEVIVQVHETSSADLVRWEVLSVGNTLSPTHSP